MLLSEVIERIPTECVTITVRLKSDLHVGTGSGGMSWVDRAIIRDSSQRPVIPGSHLKGVLRDSAEKLADIVDRSNCRAPRAENMCRLDVQPCAVCRLFGSPTIPSSILFSDLRLIDQEMVVYAPELLVSIRPGVSINRHRRVAKDARLFSSEMVSTGLTFHGSIEVLRKLTATEKSLLQRAVRFTDRLGANKSTGVGDVEIELSKEFTT